MKKTILFASFLTLSAAGISQKLTTTSSVVNFDATTPTDWLPKAENKTVIGSLDKTTGTVMFEAAVKNFTFKNPLMQEHFNSERWLNSATFPKFTFSGKIVDLSAVKFTTNGTYNASVSGSLTIKGITKTITVPAKITVNNGKISSSSSFSVTLADYGISGQSQIQSGKVAKVVKVNISASF